MTGQNARQLATCSLVFVGSQDPINPIGGTPVRRIITSALAALALVFVGTVPASAHHNAVGVDVDESAECGEVTFTSSWAEPKGEHLVNNARLVVLADGEQQDAAIGESITVGPFESDTTIQYRVWGGGERDYDDPALSDLDALVAYLDASDDNSPLDVDAPGIAWSELDVTGCAPIDVEPEAPTKTDQKCDDTPGSISVPDVEGVSYEITHESVTESVDAGTSHVTPGEYIVSASADEGYTLTGDVSEWTLSVAAASDCEDDSTNDDDDSNDDDSSGKNDDDESDDEKTATLPETGSNATLAGIALLLIVGGAALAFVGRKRRVAKYAATQ